MPWAKGMRENHCRVLHLVQGLAVGGVDNKTANTVAINLK